MRKYMKEMFLNEDGGETIEYGLVLMVVAALCVPLFLLRDKLIAGLNSVTEQIGSIMDGTGAGG